MQGDILLQRLKALYGPLVWHDKASFDLPPELYVRVRSSFGRLCSACGADLGYIDEHTIDLKTVKVFLRNAGGGCNWKVCLPGSSLCPACWEALRKKSEPAPDRAAPDVERLYAYTEDDGVYRETIGECAPSLFGETHERYA